MKLYLVQHAKAKSKEEDPDRPLSEEGWLDIRRVAAYVAWHADIELEQVYHSGKTRAKQTAEALAEAIRAPKGAKEADDLHALDDPSLWANRLKETGGDVMLVGHMPYMSKMAALLLCGDPDHSVVAFQKGGVVCLEQDEEENWALAWMVIPQIVNAPNTE